MPACSSLSLGTRGLTRYLIPAFSIVLVVTFIFSQPNTVGLKAPHLSWSGSKSDSSPYYSWKTPSFFPPLRPNSSAVESLDLCSNFPRYLLENVQVVLKTGVGEHSRLDSQLATVSSCITNLLVFSDYQEKRGEYELIDILADLPESYRLNNEAFGAYAAQRQALERGEEVHKSGEGWKLDKFKFLPMVEKAYQRRPNAQWYVFIETDTYLFWDNLFRLLSQYDPVQPHYIGAPVVVANHHFFGYGGAGIVLSQGLLQKLLARKTSREGDYIEPTLSERYEEWVRRDCCGDNILSHVIEDKTGVKIKRLWPMFNGEELIKVGVDAWSWCVPLIAMHRLSPEQMNDVWRWERTRSYEEVCCISVFTSFA
jgi:hypothetical protein